MITNPYNYYGLYDKDFADRFNRNGGLEMFYLISPISKTIAISVATAVVKDKITKNKG